MHHNGYTVGPSDQFDPANYSLINDEIQIINEKTHTFRPYFKVEILISFLKNHCLQTNWIYNNHNLTDFVTSGTLFTGQIESLFESSRYNKSFRDQFEKYLKKRLFTPLG